MSQLMKNLGGIAKNLKNKLQHTENEQDDAVCDFNPTDFRGQSAHKASSDSNSSDGLDEVNIMNFGLGSQIASQSTIPADIQQSINMSNEDFFGDISSTHNTEKQPNIAQPASNTANTMSLDDIFGSSGSSQSTNQQNISSGSSTVSSLDDFVAENSSQNKGVKQKSTDDPFDSLSDFIASKPKEASAIQSGAVNSGNDFFSMDSSGGETPNLTTPPMRPRGLSAILGPGASTPEGSERKSSTLRPKEMSPISAMLQGGTSTVQHKSSLSTPVVPQVQKEYVVQQTTKVISVDDDASKLQAVDDARNARKESQEVKELRAQIEDLKKELKEVKRERAELQSNQVDRSAASMKADLDLALMDKSVLESQLQSQKGTNERQKRRIMELEEENRGLKAGGGGASSESEMWKKRSSLFRKQLIRAWLREGKGQETINTMIGDIESASIE